MMMKKFVMLMIVAMVAMTANAAIIGELGILDSSTGLTAGDQYRLVFLSSTTTQATSADIATYNAFVQGLATTAGLGGTWNIIGSTLTVDARDNTGTNPDNGIGVPIFRMDGMTAIALTNDDLWDGGIDAFINLDENGDYFIDDRIFTGSETNGTSSGATGDTALGVPAGAGFNGVQTGKQERTSGSWIKNFNMPETGFHPVYAMSEPLTVVPEPATMLLLGLGGLVLRRRRA